VNGTADATGSGSAPALVPVADHALLVEFGDEIDDHTLARIQSLDAALGASPPEGLVEVVPALTHLLVVFDPLVTDHRAIADAVTDRIEHRATTAPGTHHVVDICFDAPHAPNLAAAAEQLGIDPDEVARQHLSAVYRVGMYGFAPGYAYLYGAPPAIRLPRNPTPGPPVPAGSVIITGQQCLVIPVAMSTGWFAIGRSPVQVLRDDPARPFLFDVGDTVSFRRIAAHELEARLPAEWR
jgi:inhibitor of KinA